MVKIKDVNIADFGIEAITDNGRVQLKENKEGPLSVDTYNKMIDPNSSLSFKTLDSDYSNFTFLGTWSNHYKSWKNNKIGKREY